MDRSIFKILLPIILVIAVFFTAKYLDSNPRTVVSDSASAETQRQPEMSETREYLYQEATEPTLPEAAEQEVTEATEATETVQPAETVPEETQTQRRYVFTFGGDCTLSGPGGIVTSGDGIVTVIGEDYQYPFRNIRSWFAGDDFTMINLECVLTDSGFPVVDEYPFRGAEAYVEILSGSSVENVSLANNHTLDYGIDGYNRTREVLENVGITYVERDKSRMFTLKDGLTVGIYTSVYYNMDTAVIRKEITALREAGADIVIFAAHWGYEGNYKPREQEIALAHAAVEAGADIIYGTHPHVLQPVETYQNGVIFYSLGNLCYGGNVHLKDMDTALIQVEVVVGEDGVATVDKWTAIPCSISFVEDRNNYQPTPYAADSEGYRRVMSKLDGSWDKDYVEN